MKNTQKLCLTVLMLCVISSFSIKIKIESVTWTMVESTVSDNVKVKVYYPSNKMTAPNLNDILSKIYLQVKATTTDFFVVNTEAVFWFVNKANSDSRSDLKVAGGLLGGIWELTKIAGLNNSVTYSLRPENKDNLLFTNEGSAVLGEYSDNNGGSNTKIFWGLQENRDSAPTANNGKAIEANEGGVYSDNGIKIEFSGLVTNQLATAVNGSAKQTAKVDEFSTSIDTDPSTTSGTTKYTLSWRIPANKSELSVQMSVKPLSGNMPISQMRWELNYQAKVKSTSVSNPDSSIPVSYEAVASPELMLGNSSTSLAHVDVNKYFTNSCVKSLFNYEFKDATKAFAVKTPPGRGQVLCSGSPVHKVSFICAYPNNDNLPKEAYEDYVLHLSEKKVSETSRKINFSYTLLKSKPMQLSSTNYVTMGMRIKFIDATPALA